jgi:hypothetical protein
MKILDHLLCASSGVFAGLSIYYLVAGSPFLFVACAAASVIGYRMGGMGS